MDIIYLSEGEQNCRMPLDTLEANLRSSGTDEDVIAGIREAIDDDGFWFGELDVYRVVVVSVERAERLIAGAVL